MTHFRLEVVATLDPNNNAKPDWVLWLADEARPGNYRQYQALVIYDVSDSGPLRAAPLVALGLNREIVLDRRMRLKRSAELGRAP